MTVTFGESRHYRRNEYFALQLGVEVNDAPFLPYRSTKIPVLSTSKRELKKAIKKDDYNFCSNRTTTYGASAIFIPGVLEKIGDAIGDFYIVPTSVHEVMILEVDAAPPVAVILNALKEQNQDRNCVEVEDILSDAVFYYDAKSRKVTKI